MVIRSSASQTTIERRLELTLQQALRARAVAAKEPDLIETAGEALAAIERELGPDPRMDRIAQRLALTPEQVAFVWAVLGGGHARRGLSVAVYARLAELDGPATKRLSDWLANDNPLVWVGLIRAAEQASVAAIPFTASPRLSTFLGGDDRPAAPLALASVPDGVLHDQRQRSIIAQISEVLRHRGRPLIVVEGPTGSGRVTACACASSMELIVLDLARISLAQLGDALGALRRECVLREVVPVIANVDLVLGENRLAEREMIRGTIDGIAGPVIATASVLESELGSEHALVRVRWEVAETEIRAALWARAARSEGLSIAEDLAPLAHRFRAGPAAIERAVASVRLLHPPGATFRAADLAAGLRHNIAERLTGLARRVEVKETWQDLVLAPDSLDTVQAIIGRVVDAHQVLDLWGYRGKIARGTGIAVLFSGPPATGKTMVAGLIARELGLDLYQVDISRVVSKWVGETEKNLARVFDAAEEGHGLLLFDEADALFAKRSPNVQGAVDRYANLEVNYLLQRVEAFGGITILTTNLETAIDPALKRRLAAHVTFAMPDRHEQVMLWERLTRTGSAPIDPGVDFERLARDFDKMSGANIRNAAIAAAYLAAGARAPAITMELLYRAARAEYRSMGHVFADRGGL
jgi:hypothetical protein